MRSPSAKLDGSEELRGFVVKAYPTQEQAKELYAMQCECRIIWNYLVEQHQAHIRRCIDKAVADGAIRPLSDRPAKDAPIKERRGWQRSYERAQFAASQHCKRLEEYRWPPLTMRADCYQPLRERCEREIGRHLSSNISMTRAVIARFAASRIPKRGGNWRPPRWKKEQPPWLEHTMLQVRDGARFVGGTFGPRGWHDCQLLLCGIRLDCRAGRDIPEGRVVDGASVVRKADGWYAAVRIARQPRRAIEPTRAEVGLCLGLLALAVTSDNECWVNPRGNEYSKLCAYMQEQQAEASDPNAAWDLGARRRRYQLRMQRRTREIILAEILPTLARYSTIVLGTLSRQDVQGPQCRLSGEDDDGGALSAAGALRSLIKERVRERVVEIDLPGVDDVSPDETARKLLAKYWEIKPILDGGSQPMRGSAKPATARPPLIDIDRRELSTDARIGEARDLHPAFSRRLTAALNRCADRRSPRPPR